VSGATETEWQRQRRIFSLFESILDEMRSKRDVFQMKDAADLEIDSSVAFPFWSSVQYRCPTGLRHRCPMGMRVGQSFRVCHPERSG
jgi:hypothetical protein